MKDIILMMMYCLLFWGGTLSVYAQNKSRFLINLTISSSASATAADKTRIVFNDAKLLTYESECDAAKFMSDNSVYQLYSLDADGVMYSINERPFNDGCVKLGIVVPTKGQVCISSTRLDCGVILIDNTTHKVHNLSAGPYIFNSTAGTFNNRFILRTISSLPKGDINYDTKVDITDLALLIANLNGNTPSNFVEAAAKIDSDDDIDKDDVTALINLILNNE